MGMGISGVADVNEPIVHRSSCSQNPLAFPAVSLGAALRAKLLLWLTMHLTVLQLYSLELQGFPSRPGA